MTYGELLARARLKRGYSKAGLAREANFDHSYVARLESGNRTPSFRAVKRLNEALGLAEESAEAQEMMHAVGFASGQPVAEPVIEYREAVESPWESVRLLRNLLDDPAMPAWLKYQMNHITIDLITLTHTALVMGLPTTGEDTDETLRAGPDGPDHSDPPGRLEAP